MRAADLALSTPDPAREALRRGLERDVERWLGDGHVIKQVPMGATGAGGGFLRGAGGNVEVRRDRRAVGWRRAAFKAMGMAGLRAGAVAAALRIEQSRAYGALYNARNDRGPEVRERAEALLEWARG